MYINKFSKISSLDLNGESKAIQTVPSSHLWLTLQPVLNLDLLQACSFVYYMH